MQELRANKKTFLFEYGQEFNFSEAYRPRVGIIERIRPFVNEWIKILLLLLL
jgi:hypothetical protein